MLWNLLAFLLVGVIAGWLASLIMRTDASQGFWLDMLVGVIGAYIGGFLASALGGYGVTGFNLPSILIAFLGSVILLAIVKAVNRRPVSV